MLVYAGSALAEYGFGDGHPFGPDRFHVFWQALQAQGLDKRVEIRPPVPGKREDALLFHTPDYVQRVEQMSREGNAMLDADTPAFKGVYQAALTVVGTVLDASDQILSGETPGAFVPIAGLHHARRDGSAGFCVFNDCGIAIEAARQRYGVEKLAYVDIDAHHGDGVFYAFEEDPGVIIVDLHEDGRFLYPGTGAVEETGKGRAAGTKLNIPLPPGANDRMFFDLWPRVERFVEKNSPEFIILQCGADSMAGDPITDMAFSHHAHRHAAGALSRLAARCGARGVLALGGGGYNRENLARAWTAVVEALTEG